MNLLHKEFVRAPGGQRTDTSLSLQNWLCNSLMPAAFKCLFYGIQSETRFPCQICECARACVCVCVCVVGRVWLFETLWTVPLRNEDEDETVALPDLCCRHTGPRDARQWRFTSLGLRRFSEAGIKPESIVKPPGYSSWSGLHFSVPLYISTYFHH